MHKMLTLTTAGLVALAGCRSAEVETGTRAGAQPAPPPATADAVPAGTLLEGRLNQRLSTDRNRVGDRFTLTLTQSIVAQNGQVAIPAGATVTGVVTGLDDSDHVGDQAAIRVDFERISFNNRSYELRAEVVDTEVELKGDRSRRAGERAAIGAAAGAALGAIIGGDLKDVLIGGAIGAGAGTIISLGVGDVEAALPAGSTLSLRTREHLYLR